MNYQSAPDSFLSALSTRDFGLFAECLAPQAQARLLLPPGPEVRTGREEIARRFRGLVLARDCLRGPRNTPGTGRASRAAQLALPHEPRGQAARDRRASRLRQRAAGWDLPDRLAVFGVCPRGGRRASCAVEAGPSRGAR